MLWFLHIFVVPTWFDELVNDNKRDLLGSEYPPEDVHDLSENSPNTNPPVIWITAIFAPLSSKLAWKSDVFQPCLDHRSQELQISRYYNLHQPPLSCIDLLFYWISEMKDDNYPGY